VFEEGEHHGGVSCEAGAASSAAASQRASLGDASVESKQIMMDSAQTVHLLSRELQHDLHFAKRQETIYLWSK
jgi:hypothetical protein